MLATVEFAEPSRALQRLPAVHQEEPGSPIWHCAESFQHPAPSLLQSTCQVWIFRAKVHLWIEPQQPPRRPIDHEQGIRESLLVRLCDWPLPSSGALGKLKHRGTK